MGLFAQTKKVAGWLVIRIQEEGVSVAYVRRPPAAAPVVEVLAFYQMDASAQASTLEKLAKDLHVNRYQCASLLGAGEYQILSVDAPNVPRDELKTAIRWRLKDMLDFHINDATIDVLDVPIEKGAPERNHSMYAVAARNQVISQRQAMFAEAKIPLNVIDIPEMAQRNISSLLESDKRGLAVLSFDSEGGLLTITFSGELYLSRRIDVRFSELEAASADQKNAFFDKVTLELQRSLDHFDRQYHYITMSKLVLAPLAHSASELQEYLAANLYLPVEVMDLEAVLDISRMPELKSLAVQQRYFLTIGAALRYEEKAF